MIFLRLWRVAYKHPKELIIALLILCAVAAFTYGKHEGAKAARMSVSRDSAVVATKRAEAERDQAARMAGVLAIALDSAKAHTDAITGGVIRDGARHRSALDAAADSIAALTEGNADVARQLARIRAASDSLARQTAALIAAHAAERQAAREREAALERGLKAANEVAAGYQRQLDLVPDPPRFGIKTGIAIGVAATAGAVLLAGMLAP